MHPRYVWCWQAIRNKGQPGAGQLFNTISPAGEYLNFTDGAEYDWRSPLARRQLAQRNVTRSGSSSIVRLLARRLPFLDRARDTAEYQQLQHQLLASGNAVLVQHRQPDDGRPILDAVRSTNPGPAVFQPRLLSGPAQRAGLRIRPRVRWM